MLFSVVIPTYNRAHVLGRTLESVWRQRFTDYEVVVVDDGSTDGTQAYLRGLGSKVRAIRQANGGPGVARNTGVREAKGAYVALLDSDDLWFPWTLDVFARAIREHRCPNILGGKFVEFTAEEELPGIREESYETSRFADYIASSRYPYYVGSGTCVLYRAAFARVKFLEDRLNAEDHDLILQIGTLPGFVRVVAPVTLAWRRHAASETGVFASTVSGTLRLLARETTGAYPGGRERSRQRHRILARHTRPTALACVRNGEVKQGWELYRLTVGWNVVLGHWKYVLAFPIVAVLALLRRVKIRKGRPA
jgi:glycosyltransferase involved in cell wall biosynthesis